MNLTPNSYFIFPGGEVHCRYDDQSTFNFGRIICTDYTMNGFMAVCEYNEVLKRKDYSTSLVYPYFPYARQDRIMNPDEPFSLKIFCDLLNAQNFHDVTIWDPHSDVAPALTNNCKVWSQEDLVQCQSGMKQYLNNPFVTWVSPDAGAYKKLSKLITDDSRIAIGLKYRDSNGDVAGTNVLSPNSLEGSVCVIVDDICDGGRTFIELARVLKDKGAKKVVLYVTHAILSKGQGVLREYIDEMYTTNSFPH